ncbi:MAG: nucleotide sugar dehydrogenase [Acidiferrobacterales bacterium]
MIDLGQVKIGIVGLGYVGLPLAIEFSKCFPTHGFDTDAERINELLKGFDRAGELSIENFSNASQLQFHHEEEALAQCNVYIVAVPTPINEHKWPDLKPLRDASRLVGKQINKNDIVIYESTVYPGATEEVCIPILEQESGLTLNTDIFIGYSPERINPGDASRKLPTIKKLVSGSTNEVADFVAALYQRIITAGVYKTESIAVAEAAKVIENIQRDVNIALVNELAQILNRLKIDTEQVLTAAGTKWNFLPFRPGLVGGHCIGVDPYYLTHKAQAAGYQPTIIPASRLVNEGMGEYVANETLKAMARKGINIVKSRILILGLAFKENCADLRNTKVTDIFVTLGNYQASVDIYDPVVDVAVAKRYLGLDLLADWPKSATYDAIIIAVAHAQFRDMKPEAIRKLGKPLSVIYDVKSILPDKLSDVRL